MSKKFLLKSSLLVLMTIGLTQGCGIFSWDPLYICMNKETKVTEHPLLVRKAILEVLNTLTDASEFSDFTTIGLEIQTLEPS